MGWCNSFIFHPWLSENTAPVGLQEVMQLLKDSQGFPTVDNGFGQVGENRHCVFGPSLWHSAVEALDNQQYYQLWA